MRASTPRRLSCAALLLAAAAPGALAAGTTERVSVTSDERQLDGGSTQPSISGDGGRVAFATTARAFGGTPLGAQIAVRDRRAGTTVPVVVGIGGAAPNGFSANPHVSRDGRFVAFDSLASNLVAGDANGRGDVFRRDLATGTTVRVSLKGAGGQIRGGASEARAISGDGRVVAFITRARAISPANPGPILNVFTRDMARGRTTLESVAAGGGRADGDSVAFSLSGSGRYLCFSSFASNLVANDGNGRVGDAFVRDRQTGRTVLASVGAGGAPGDNDSFGCYVSDDGNVVAFESFAGNLVAGDGDEFQDVFVRDLRAGTTVRASARLGAASTEGNVAVTGISADGRFVVFDTRASDIVPGDTNGLDDAFVYDRVARTVTRVSVSASGAQGAAGSGDAAISADGGAVAFASQAPNLVPGDTNGDSDVFVREVGR